MNRLSSELQFFLEPWGEQYRLVPGAQIVVIATADAEGELEVQLNSAQITVFGWVGSTVRVVQDGNATNV